MPEYKIWKFANAGQEIDDWLPYAKNLIRQCLIQSSDEVKSKVTFDITLAALLLHDDLLPASASGSFAKLMI